MSEPTVDVLAVMDAAIESDRRQGPQASRAALHEARAAVAELIEAGTKMKRAYWLARNSAAGLTNYCPESASSRRCERELEEAERIYRDSEFDAALARVGGAKS